MINLSHSVIDTKRYRILYRTFGISLDRKEYYPTYPLIPWNTGYSSLSDKKKNRNMCVPFNLVFCLLLLNKLINLDYWPIKIFIKFIYHMLL